MLGFNLLASLFRQEKEPAQHMRSDLSIREKYYEFGSRVRTKVYEIRDLADYEREVKKIESDLGLNLTCEQIEKTRQWFKAAEYSRFRARLAKALMMHRKMQGRKTFTRREAR
jgi:hypothetical protein